MKIYNTMTKTKEEFKPIEKGKVKIYLCGPTVYNLIHIGNARPICVFDTLRRYMAYTGLELNFIQNFTDVDDKIIKKANSEGVAPSVISERYIEEYNKDAEELNVMTPDLRPKVTENMDAIISFISTLVEKGFAYEANSDVYFRTEKFEEYGKLSHMPLEDLEAGARIDVNSVKENPMDFALWKAAKPSEPSWSSPWGEGRPGWHIECSAMVNKFLGSTIDIHGGGQDLVFPHHENEIAQSECATGHEFANYWMHVAYLNIDNKKMSKSLNNFFTTREVGEKYGYEPIRLLMLQAHYRSQINYTVEVLEACKASLERLYNCKDNIKRSLPNAKNSEITEEENNSLISFKQDFIKAMEDDLNTADALSAIFELVREINTKLSDESVTCGYIEVAQKMFIELTGILGLLYTDKEEKIPQEILDLVEKRKQARKDKDFALADKIRDEISELGFAVEETRQGIKITKKEL